MPFLDYLNEYIRTNVLGTENIFELTVVGDRQEFTFGGDIDRLLSTVEKVNTEPDDTQTIYNIDLTFEDIENPIWQRQSVINKVEKMVKDKIKLKDYYEIVQPEVKLINSKPYRIRISIVINKGNPEGQKIAAGNPGLVPTAI